MIWQRKIPFLTILLWMFFCLLLLLFHISAYINSCIYNMQTHQNKIFINQSCFTAIKKSRCSNHKEHVSTTHDTECTCQIQWCTICMLSLSISGIVVFIIINARKLNLFRGHLFWNSVKIMLFISDALDYVPVKLCRTAGSIHLFKITGNSWTC